MRTKSDNGPALFPASWTAGVICISKYAIYYQKRNSWKMTHELSNPIRNRTILFVQKARGPEKQTE